MSFILGGDTPGAEGPMKSLKQELNTSGRQSLKIRTTLWPMPESLIASSCLASLVLTIHDKSCRKPSRPPWPPFNWTRRMGKPTLHWHRPNLSMNGIGREPRQIFSKRYDSAQFIQ